MAFKSYAKGGNYGTYNILPISSEINEDLRAANEKVQDIQLTAQAKANHAQEYIGALNDKFKVEQQNRDQNNQFFKDNHKRIYEGEQRQFEGEMAELRRRHAEEARKEAEPSTLEKALPHILSLVQIGAGMVAETAAAETQAKVGQVHELNQQSEAAGFDTSQVMNSEAWKEATPEIRNELMQSYATRWQNATGGSPGERERFIDNMKVAANAKGEVLEARQGLALQRAHNNAVYQTKTDQSTDPARHSDYKAYSSHLRKTYNKNLRNYLGGGAPGTDEGVTAGSEYLAGVGQRVMQGHYKQSSRFFNTELNAGLKVHEQNSRKDYLTGVQSRVHQAYHNKGPWTNSSGTPAENIHELIIGETGLLKVDANGDIGYVMDTLEQVIPQDPSIDVETLRQVKTLVRNSNPGTAAANPAYQTEVDNTFNKMIDDKEKAKINAVTRHNQLKRAQGLEVIGQVNSLKSQSEQKAFINGLHESDVFRTLDATTQKELNAISAGHQSTAKEQAKKYSSYFPKQAVTERVETEITKQILDKYPDVKEVNISAWELQKVINDTMRLLPGEIGTDEAGFRENPENAFNAALTKALDGHDWSIEKTGVKADVGLTGKRTNQPQQVLETNLGRVDWTNPGPQLKEILLANQGYSNTIRSYGNQINRWYENNPGQEMSYTDLAASPMLNSHMVTSAIEAANDPTLSRSYVFMKLLEAASEGKAPNISSAVIKPPQVAAARAAGFNARPESTVGMGVYSGTTSITPASYSTHAYTTGNIGGSGPHLDIKRLNNQGEWDLGILDNYVYVMDPEHGKVSLSQLRGLTGNVGDSWKEHAARSTPSRGWDIGTHPGTKLYVQNGAKVISNVATGRNGDMTIIEIPGEGQFKMFHGRGN